MNEQYAFSVFTPTFNRGYCLPNVYASLLSQDFNNFEWIIIDDGSTDNTKDIVNKFISENILNIKFISQDNKGKHVAQNRALDAASGELFLPLDSDDVIVPNALSKLWSVWSEIKSDIGYSGIGVHCMDGNGKVIGDLWPKDEMDSNDLEMTFKHHVRGEKWGPIRTDVMRQCLNDEIAGHYLSESTVWFRIANNYKKRYVNEVLRVYEISEDSISKKSSFIRDENAESKLHSNLIFLNEFGDWYWRYDFPTAVSLCLSSMKASIGLGKHLLFGETSLINKVDGLLPKVVITATAPVIRPYIWFQKALETRNMR